MCVSSIRVYSKREKKEITQQNLLESVAVDVREFFNLERAI